MSFNFGLCSFIPNIYWIHELEVVIRCPFLNKIEEEVYLRRSIQTIKSVTRVTNEINIEPKIIW